MKRILILAAIIMVCVTGAAGAEEEKVTGAASVDIMSNYVWRGIKVSNSWVVQPNLSVAYKGFGAGFWANYDSDSFETDSHGSVSDGHGEFSEVDLTLSYAKSFDKLTVGGGYIYYAFDGFSDTQEVYASVSYDTFLKPALTVYYDFDEGDGAFITASIGHSFSLPADMSLNLGALASYNIRNRIMGLDADGRRFSNFYHAELSSSLTIPVTKMISVTPKIAYSFAISNDAKAAMRGLANDGRRDIVYGALNLTFSF